MVTANPREGLSGGVCPGKAGKAEHLQPVGMSLTGQEFGGGLADALGFLAAQERLVIKKETQQVEVGGTDLATPEAIVAQPTVEVLDQGAGTVAVVAQRVQRLLEGEKATLELPVQGAGLGPIGGGGGRQSR